MTLQDHQSDMRAGYLCGAPGLFVSGTVWLIAGAVAALGGAPRGAWTLLLGGMLIFPVAVGVTKLLGHAGRHTAGNPLGVAAVEGTVWFVAGIAVAFVVGLARVELFFPAMLLLIGGRYLTFQTLYGLRFYWGCGAVLVGVGFAAAFLRVPPPWVAAAGGIVEIVGGVVVLRMGRVG